MDSGERRRCRENKRERTQRNKEPPPAMGIAEGGVQANKSGDSDLVHLVGFGVDDMNAAGHTGIKGMNGS